MKKTIRRIALLLLLLLILLSMFACGEFMPFGVASTPTPIPTEKPLPSPRPALESAQSDLYIIGGVTQKAGYYSSIFEIGFDPPQDWLVLDENVIDGVNHVTADPNDPAVRREAYESNLKQGSYILEYYAYREKPYASITVVARQKTSSEGESFSELEVLDEMQLWLLDENNDQMLEVDKIALTTLEVFGGEHPIYQFESTKDNAKVYGAILVYKMNTLFDVFEVMANSEEELMEILQSFHKVN